MQHNTITDLIEYNNKPVRLSGIAKNATIAPKYLNNTYKYHWIYTFRYIGTDEFISFEFDFYDKFVGVVKNN
jgi:hypothetical protein